MLVHRGIPFKYHFTDISSSFVMVARRKYAAHAGSMEFLVLDIEQEPAAEFVSRFDIVLSTNCIHGTRNLVASLRHAHQMLRHNGLICLIEITKRLFWLDLVFGLLQGWWLFEDGRSHPLASYALWEKSMLSAGFEQVLTINGPSLQSQTVGLICGFTSKFDSVKSHPRAREIDYETVVFKTGKPHLYADIHYPSEGQRGPEYKYPIALLIHGGGHVMLSRKHSRMDQVHRLLGHDIIPKLATTASTEALRHHFEWRSSADCCPETRPPEAITTFYCPTDYEDEFWKTPQDSQSRLQIDGVDSLILEGLENEPVTGFDPNQAEGVQARMASTDRRSRIFAHMVQQGQSLQVLANGLPPPNAVPPSQMKSILSQQDPPLDRVRQYSPYACAADNMYRSSTYMLHGKKDELVPWQQALKMLSMLQKHGIPCDLALLEDAMHLFDTNAGRSGGWDRSIARAYEFFASYLHAADSDEGTISSGLSGK
ncbi:ketoacyl-synt-domain-containing protein [Aspergillus affinis]|uniref:ketoacyl-synt-domain-containing protein n=1 Tax=Aspergillus affinis TaxID=1070780 RepID=UPI0022FF2A77|nr:ketoacyl-synt-domain-containing protein [Aspergillus affinis]KAI9044399.1 ketoacyl-synt-domain-containing protein [Aspergillus affinis]